MNNFWRIALNLLQLVAFLLFVFSLISLGLFHATGHNVPHDTNVYYGLGCVGSLLVVLLCRLVLWMMNRKQDFTAPNKAARNKK